MRRFAPTYLVASGASPLRRQIGQLARPSGTQPRRARPGSRIMVQRASVTTRGRETLLQRHRVQERRSPRGTGHLERGTHWRATMPQMCQSDGGQCPGGHGRVLHDGRQYEPVAMLRKPVQRLIVPPSALCVLGCVFVCVCPMGPCLVSCVGAWVCIHVCMPHGFSIATTMGQARRDPPDLGMVRYQLLRTHTARARCQTLRTFVDQGSCTGGLGGRYAPTC